MFTMALMEITKMEVKATATFVFKELYTSLHHFMVDEGWPKDEDAGFPEKFYWESRSQTSGKEYWVWWRFTKGVDTGLAKKHISIDIHGVGVRDVEIMYQGKKIKANKGKLEVIIRGHLEVDPGDSWKSGSWGFLRDIFIKRYWRKELLEYRSDVVKDMKKVRGFVADFINKPVGVGLPEAFHPRMGYERENF